MFSINLSKARRGKNYNKTAKLIKANNKIITNETILKQSARYAGVKVKIYDKSNNLINEFPTITSTAKSLGVSNRTINNILNTGISYDDYTYKFEVVIGYSIIVVNKENDSIKEYYSISAAAKDLAVKRESVSKHINTNKLLKGIYLISRKLI
jgi:NUMOD1 domain